MEKRRIQRNRKLLKEKNKKEEIPRQNQEKNTEQLEDKQKMSQQEFEESLMKIKFITFGIMGNIRWDKVKLKFQKGEKGKETALFMFEVEERGCFIEYNISEEDKQKFLKTNTSEIVERFIIQHLINYGINGYFDDKCPECKQTTLTKALVTNDPNEEAIACNLCGWAEFMDIYNKYLNDKKHNPFLEFPEWLEKNNNKTKQKF